VKGIIRAKKINIPGEKIVNVWFFPDGSSDKLLLGDLNGALGRYFKDKFPIVYEKLKEGYEIIADVEMIKSGKSGDVSKYFAKEAEKANEQD